MTEKQLICLKYLSDKMEATARMVGEDIVYQIAHKAGMKVLEYPATAARSGAVILGRLRYLGLVMRLPDLKAWRITREGREFLTTLSTNKGA